MHIKYFGDSYDIVKRFFVSNLGALGPWSVQPMFAEPTESKDAERFAAFIGASLLSRTLVGTTAERAESLAASKSSGHLLLDPDIGLKMLDAPKSPSPAHLYGDELTEIVGARPSYLTVVFDQSVARAAHAQQLKEKRQKLAYFRKKGIGGFVYDSHASFVFLSQEAALIEKAFLALRRTGLPESRLVRPK